MAIYHGGKAKVMLGSQKIKNGYLGATKVYSSGNIVTYAVHGENYTQEFDECESVLSPSVVTPTLSGATFLGWSTSPSSTSVITNLMMEGEPITLYAVFKYADTTLSTRQYVNISEPTSTTRGHTEITETSLTASIDTTKYSYGVVYSYVTSIKTSGRASAAAAKYRIGNSYSSNFAAVSVGWGTESDGSYKKDSGYSNPITGINISNTGKAEVLTLVLSATCNDAYATAGMYYNNTSSPQGYIALTGRTIVG